MTKEGDTKRKSTQERNQIRNKEERILMENFKSMLF
jgi:hypothetical protein